MYRDALNATGRRVYLQICNTLHWDGPHPEMDGAGGFAATIRPWATQGRDVRELANSLFIQVCVEARSCGVSGRSLARRPVRVGLAVRVGSSLTSLQTAAVASLLDTSRPII